MTIDTEAVTRRGYLRLDELQIRSERGETPTFVGDEVYHAFLRAGEGDVRKLMFSFTDGEGDSVDITIRNIGSVEEPEWVLYGDRRQKGVESSRIEGIPSHNDMFFLATGKSWE